MDQSINDSGFVDGNTYGRKTTTFTVDPKVIE